MFLLYQTDDGKEDFRRDYIMKTFQRSRYHEGNMLDSGELMTRVERMGTLIDQVAVDVFQAFVTELLSRPITYIIPAVWGTKKNGELTSAQKQMNNMIAPVIEDIFKTIDTASLDKSQQFAVGYLIRGLMISKITYMIEKMKNQLIEKIISDYRRNELLSDAEPIGTA